MKPMPTALAAAALLLVTGCGTEAAGGRSADAKRAPASSPARSGPAEPRFNETDVMFLQMMLAHHEPAGELLRLARTRARDPEIRTLAAAIEVTQADEMETMRGWLRSWDQPLASDAHPDAHAAHGGLPATGAKEITALANTPTREFDRAFLNMFIGHQHNAVELARMETQGGANFKVRALAGRVDQAARAQIQHMLRLVA